MDGRLEYMHTKGVLFSKESVFETSLENTFHFESKTPQAKQQPSRPSITADTAIQIVLHSADVICF